MEWPLYNQASPGYYYSVLGDNRFQVRPWRLKGDSENPLFSKP